MNDDTKTSTDSKEKEGASEATPETNATNGGKGADKKAEEIDMTMDTEKDGKEGETEEEKKKREDELRKKYADWPLEGIKEPHDNDVMYGRGGGTNHHPGNKNYRKLVEDRKVEYVNSKRLDKPLVALEIISIWRAQIPPGRFLKMDDKTGTWHDVGDKKAREKTSQALREKAPMIRKQQEDDRTEPKDGEASEPDAQGTKTTRFTEGTKTEDASQVQKAKLARDHSLGREYLEAGQAVSLDGFSWQDPFQADKRKKESSFGAPPPPTNAPTSYPAGRNSSHGSLGMAPPHHTSIGGPPPPPDYWGRGASGGERQREFSNGRFESWGPYPYPPPPASGQSMHQRSGSWTNAPPPPPPPHGPVHQRSGSWGSGRENSLGMFPLIGASVAGPADRGTFDSGGRSSSGFWGAPVSGSPARGNLPPPPPGPYGGAPIRSNGSLGPYRQPISPSTSISPPPNGTPSPKPAYNVDLNIAKTWSGGEVRRTWSGEQQGSGQPPRGYDDLPQPPSAAPHSPMRHGADGVPRPQMVKRDTSHQNESYETKPSVKRAALNRDNSLASNRLKQEYMPEYFNRRFDTEQEMKMLSNNLEQSTLETERPKPTPLSESERITTMDAIAMALAKPAPILKEGRVSTIDALDLDLADTDQFVTAVQPEPAVPTINELPKPKSLEPDDRITTKDFMEMVTAPIETVPEDSNAKGGSEDEPLPLTQVTGEWLTQV